MSDRLEELTNEQLVRMLRASTDALDEQTRMTAAASQEIARLKRESDQAYRALEDTSEIYEQTIAGLRAEIVRIPRFLRWLFL